jgi:hypothetical protein
MIQREWRTYHGEELIDSGFHDVTWEHVRAERDQALAGSDWRALKDVTLPNPWKEYRQALRDITEHPDANTAADNWPVMPDE